MCSRPADADADQAPQSAPARRDESFSFGRRYWSTALNGDGLISTDRRLTGKLILRRPVFDLVKNVVLPGANPGHAELFAHGHEVAVPPVKYCSFG